MAGAGNLYDLARRQTRDTLREIHREYGAAAAGIVADGWVRGIVDELRGILGPEAAFNMIQRHADAAAAPILKPAKHQE